MYFSVRCAYVLCTLEYVVPRYYVLYSSLCLGMMYSRVICAQVLCTLEYVVPRYYVL